VKKYTSIGREAVN
jgi:hypothetical protein